MAAEAPAPSAHCLIVCGRASPADALTSFSSKRARSMRAIQILRSPGASPGPAKEPSSRPGSSALKPAVAAWVADYEKRFCEVTSRTPAI